jgi:hypothetical protein
MPRLCLADLPPPLLVTAGPSVLDSPLRESVLSRAIPSAAPRHRLRRRLAGIGSAEPASCSVREEEKGEGGEMIREVLQGSQYKNKKKLDV